jgi:hypothetical protein
MSSTTYYRSCTKGEEGTEKPELNRVIGPPKWQRIGTDVGALQYVLYRIFLPLLIWF